MARGRRGRGRCCLWAIPPLRKHPLRVPVTYERHGPVFTAIAKAVHDDGLFHARHIGAPFRADLLDWPLGTWLPGDAGLPAHGRRAEDETKAEHQLTLVAFAAQTFSYLHYSF